MKASKQRRNADHLKIAERNLPQADVRKLFSMYS